MAQVTLKVNIYNVLFLQCDLAVTWQEASEDYRSSCLPYATPRHSVCQTLRIWQSKACYSQYLFFLSICISIKKSKQFEESSYFVSLDRHDSNILSLQVKICAAAFPKLLWGVPQVSTQGWRKSKLGSVLFFSIQNFHLPRECRESVKLFLFYLSLWFSCNSMHKLWACSFTICICMAAPVWNHADLSEAPCRHKSAHP